MNDELRHLLLEMKVNAQNNILFLKRMNRYYRCYQSGYYNLFFIELARLEKLLSEQHEENHES